MELQNLLRLSGLIEEKRVKRIKEKIEEDEESSEGIGKSDESTTSFF